MSPPVPIVARVVWVVDGEEHIDSVALGWTGLAVSIHIKHESARAKRSALRIRSPLALPRASTSSSGYRDFDGAASPERGSR
jgi:hypothetical protein